MWLQCVVQPGHVECCWEVWRRSADERVWGLSQALPVLFSSMSYSISATVFILWNACRDFCSLVSSLLIRQLPEGGLILTGCSPPCLASMESIRIEGGPLLLLILISTWESLPSFSLMPVPQKSCVVTSVLQGRSSIFTNYVLCLMMLHYVRIFRTYRICFYFTTTCNLIQCTEKPIPTHQSKECRFKTLGIK